MLLGGIVVVDQVQFRFLWRFPIDLTQEVQPLGMAVPLHAARDDGAVERAHCRKQRGRAMPLVIVDHRRAFRCGLRGQSHNLGGIDAPFASAARQVAVNGGDTSLRKPATPRDDLPRLISMRRAIS
jgi:hypothetical protein